MNQEIALKTLATEINAKHSEAEEHARTALTLALEIGESLIQAKSQVNHGEWQGWLAANISFSKRKAQTYMRLANHKDEISKCADSALLTVDGALSLIAKEQQPIPDDEVINWDSRESQIRFTMKKLGYSRAECERIYNIGEFITFTMKLFSVSDEMFENLMFRWMLNDMPKALGYDGYNDESEAEVIGLLRYVASLREASV